MADDHNDNLRAHIDALVRQSVWLQQRSARARRQAKEAIDHSTRLLRETLKSELEAAVNVAKYRKQA